jgi:hypothetical protein
MNICNINRRQWMIGSASTRDVDNEEKQGVLCVRDNQLQILGTRDISDEDNEVRGNLKKSISRCGANIH